jgi:hypothetical protein
VEYANFAHTLFLFRKILPSPPPDIPAYLSKLSRKSVRNEEFVAFMIRRVEKEFPIGWDSGFDDALSNSTIGVKSFLEKKRGGERSAREFIRKAFRRESWCAHVKTEEFLAIPEERRVAVVKENGKSRLVTMASAYQHRFKPFSQIFYNFLSRKPWLLRGEAKASSFKDFVRVSGEKFVSGDYESATDNFNKEHSIELLKAVLSRCTHVPQALKDAMVQSLSVSSIVHDGIRYVLESGQLMGDFLSFPLLCLMNFVAFKYAIPRHCPLRINGDDIAFRAREAEIKRWFEAVSDSGLTVHRGKTDVHPSRFSLNSSLFFAGRKNVVSGVFVRPKAMFKPNAESALTVGARFKASFVGHWPVGAKNNLFISFIKENAGWLRKSQVSLLRGHGIRIERRVLKSVGLLEREEFYRSLDPKFDQLTRPDGIGCPPGLTSVALTSRNRDLAKVKRDVIAECFINEAWSGSPPPESTGVLPGTFRHVPIRKFVVESVKCARRLFGDWQAFRQPGTYGIPNRRFVKFVPKKVLVPKPSAEETSRVLQEPLNFVGYRSDR